MLPHRPPVGTKSSSRLKPLRLSPSPNSLLLVFTASVFKRASNRRGIVPWGNPMALGALMLTGVVAIGLGEIIAQSFAVR